MYSYLPLMLFNLIFFLDQELFTLLVFVSATTVLFPLSVCCSNLQIERRANLKLINALICLFNMP